MIGITNNKDFINKNLLSSKISIFNYVFKINLLFPPILKQKLVNYSNSIKSFIPTSLPVNCAVDDLELFNDDIYDLLNNPTFIDQHHHNHHQPPSSQPPQSNPSLYTTNIDNGSLQSQKLFFNNLQYNSQLPQPPVQTSDQSPANQYNPHQPQHQYNQPQQQPQSQPQLSVQGAGSRQNHYHPQPSHQPSLQTSEQSSEQGLGQTFTQHSSQDGDLFDDLKYPSHYNLNMVGGSNYYFNDFNHDLIDLDIYSSSTESFISPLDDEFYKVKRESVDTNLESISNYDNMEPLNNNLDGQSDSRNIKESSEVKLEKKFGEFEVPIKHDINSINKQINPKKRKFTSSPINDAKLKKDKKENDEELKFECNHCNARFKVKGYLTRHLKKHQSFKAFKCPFYHENPSNGKGTKCHPTGGFSRRDTYKTHLKALHFIYPPGTKSNERNLISGRCAGCFSHYENNIDWLENHIEKGKCNGTLN